MISTELSKLSTEQKLQMMESLWESLCDRPSASILSPDWHGNVLAEREQALQNHTDEFEDWETAKAALRNLS